MQSTSLIIGHSATFYLRRVSERDAPFMFKLMNQKGWLTNIGDRHIDSINAAEEYLLNGPMESYKRYNFGMYTIVSKDEDKPLGTCGLLQRSYLDGPDIGFAISEEYVNQGIAYAAAQIVLQHARDDIQATTIYATVNQDNLASQKLLSKLGFENRGLLYVEDAGKELFLFSISLN